MHFTHPLMPKVFRPSHDEKVNYAYPYNIVTLSPYVYKGLGIKYKRETVWVIALIICFALYIAASHSIQRSNTYS